MNKGYEAVIGLEVHVELKTKTKIFCSCTTEFGGSPNTEDSVNLFLNNFINTNGQILTKAQRIGSSLFCLLQKRQKIIL